MRALTEQLSALQIESAILTSEHEEARATVAEREGESPAIAIALLVKMPRGFFSVSFLACVAVAEPTARYLRVRVQLIGHLQPCMTEIYLHIVARMADYMATHP